MQTPSPSQPITLSLQPVSSPPQVHHRPNKIRKKTNTDEAENKISQTLDTLNQVLKDKLNKEKENHEDECDMYAKLLATRLRKYPEPMRSRIMYEIDGLLLQNPVHLPSNVYPRNSTSLSQYSDNQYQTSTSSPVQASTPSPVHIIPQSQQYVYLTRPRVSESPAQISIPETNEILTHSSTHFIPQTAQSRYVSVMQPSNSESSVEPSPIIEETNIIPQNEINLIERAYWKATQM